MTARNRPSSRDAVGRSMSLMTPPEMAALLDSIALARESGAALYVELGVRRAGTSFRIRQYLERTGAKAHFLGVDCDPRAQKCWDSMLKRQKIQSQLSWSFELSTTEAAAAKPRAGPCAWVFVDACHCIECATGDIERWGAKVAPRGVLAVHDTTPRRRHYTKPFQHGGTRRFGVWEAVERSEREGYLSRGWRKAWDVDDKNGIRIYQKEEVS